MKAFALIRGVGTFARVPLDMKALDVRRRPICVNILDVTMEVFARIWVAQWNANVHRDILGDIVIQVREILSFYIDWIL